MGGEEVDNSSSFGFSRNTDIVKMGSEEVDKLKLKFPNARTHWVSTSARVAGGGGKLLAPKNKQTLKSQTA